MKDIKQLAWLKNELLTAQCLEVANASYCKGSIAFGDLQDLGAGSIERRYDINGDLEYYGFRYSTHINNEKIVAILKFGNNTLFPGNTYGCEY